MDTKGRLKNDLANAMRAGDAETRDVLRLLLAAVKQVEVDGRQPLDEDDVQAVLAKQAKQRRESIADYEQGGRLDLVAQEQAELAVIEAYLPQMMGREEVEAEARAVIAETGADDLRAMGQVMGQLMPKLRGRADGRLVSEVVRTLLQED